MRKEWLRFALGRHWHLQYAAQYNQRPIAPNSPPIRPSASFKPPAHVRASLWSLGRTTLCIHLLLKQVLVWQDKGEDKLKVILGCDFIHACLRLG